MLKIRLSRGGAKKRPYYHIVIADSHSARDGKFIERVGSYNPLVAKDSSERLVLKTERIKEWIGKGEPGANPVKGKPGKKSQERAAERMQKETDRLAAEAAARASAAATPPEPEIEPEPEPEPPPAENTAVEA